MNKGDTMEIWADFTFDAAHRLPHVPLGHKCSRLHGHTYCVRLVVRGEPDERTGWIMDYADIRKAWAPVHARLDHFYLNNIAGLENPTTEVLCEWLWAALGSTIPLLAVIEVSESTGTGCRMARPA